MRFLRSRLATNFAHTIPLEFGADANWIQLRKLIPPYPPLRDVRRGDQNGALANNSTLRRVEILIMDRAGAYGTRSLCMYILHRVIMGSEMLSVIQV